MLQLQGSHRRRVFHCVTWTTSFYTPEGSQPLRLVFKSSKALPSQSALGKTVSFLTMKRKCSLTVCHKYQRWQSHVSILRPVSNSPGWGLGSALAFRNWANCNIIELLPQGICGVFQVGCIGMGIVHLAFWPSICMFKAARGTKGGYDNC